MSFSRGIDIFAGTGDDLIDIISTRSAAGGGTIERTAVYAGGGDDVVQVLEDDPASLIVLGQTGDDALDATATGGGVEMYGNEGHDTALGGSGGDILIGNQGNDFVQGNAGDDILYGDDARVKRNADYSLFAVEAVDIDLGGDDVIEGGRGNDDMRGGAGNDRYIFPGDFLGDDFIFEKDAGGGRDTLDFTGFAGPAVVDLRLSSKQTVNDPHLKLTLQECRVDRGCDRQQLRRRDRRQRQGQPFVGHRR